MEILSALKPWLTRLATLPGVQCIPWRVRVDDFWAKAWVILVALFASDFGSFAQSASPEYKLKAVFLFNFAQFVEWPENAFKTTNSPLVIGVLGNDPFGKALDETVQGETVQGRQLEVRRYRRVREIQECHILFISASEAGTVKSIFAALKGRSILTVGDFPDFADSGGMIRFFKEQNKIRFRINVQAAKEARLSISSKLLQLAEVVQEKRP